MIKLQDSYYYIDKNCEICTILNMANDILVRLNSKRLKWCTLQPPNKLELKWLAYTIAINQGLL